MQFTKYLAIFKIQITNRWAYVGDLAAQSITIVMFMWIFLQLWRTTYSVSGTELLAGLSLKDTLWYLMIAESIMLSKPRLSREISRSVKDGSIAYILCKPYHYLLYQLSIGFADTITQIGFNFISGGLTVWILIGPPPTFMGWHLVLVSILLAWLIDFCINAIIGLTAFITEDVSAFEWIYSKFLLLLGGVLIPLDFFPDWLQSITKLLPFSYTIFGPARLFVDPTLQRFTALVAGQILWVVILGALVLLIFQRGSRWLSINGG